MNRSEYFNYIEEHLNLLSFRIKQRGKLNLLDLNIYSETFFADLMNQILHLKLENLNAIRHNAEGIDLIDHVNKVFAQVSATNTKQKIESSLEKEGLKEYQEYRFIFIALTGDSEKLRTESYKNKYGVRFYPEQDIYDINTILRSILTMKIGEQYKLYTLVKDELGKKVDISRCNSNLAYIINILAKEDLANVLKSPEINTFEINRKIDFNNLMNAKVTIDMYKIFYSKLDEIYTEFDKLSVNKSFSVFSLLATEYARMQNKAEDEADLFYAIIESVMKIIQNSKNYIEIPYEELEMCVCIIVVDAFVRCKIFRNPEGYHHVITR